MTDYIDLGSSPCDEDCAQVGSDNYRHRARTECTAYINQLKRMFPTLSDTPVTLRIKSNPHDFGTYYEVIAEFNENDPRACALAYAMENGAPATWDDEARKELAEAERVP